MPYVQVRERALAVNIHPNISRLRRRMTRRSSASKLAADAPAGTFRGAQSIANDVFATVPQNFNDFRAEPEQFIDAVSTSLLFRGKAMSGTNSTRRL
jgi:hypothetical protein